MTINELRKVTGLSRTKFADQYNMPLRTVEDWEKGLHNPPEYVLNLLERAVREDFKLPSDYMVVIIDDKNDQEDFCYVGKNIVEAIKDARYQDAHLVKADHSHVEIRMYSKYFEDEDERNNWDYEIIEF